MEPAELGTWFEVMAPGLVLYARQIAGAGAEDAVQEVFLRLAAQPRMPGNVKAWLLLAVRRAALDAARSERRRVVRDRQAGVVRPMFERALPDAAIAAQEAEAALRSLALEQREIVTLRIWNDATFEEIGGILGMPMSTVHQRYQAALETLRARWEVPCPKK